MLNYITAETISKEIGVTQKTVREWLKSGELVGIKVGSSWRIHRTDFDRYIEGQRLGALLQKAKIKHPNTNWIEGQCSECGEYMVTPEQGSTHWVCSTSCKIEHDRKWEVIVGRGEDYAYNCATVVPHF